MRAIFFLFVLFTFFINSTFAQEYHFFMREADDIKNYEVVVNIEKEYVQLKDRNDNHIVFESKYHQALLNNSKVLFSFKNMERPVESVTTDNQFFIMAPSALMCNSPYDYDLLFDLQPIIISEYRDKVKSMMETFVFYLLLKSGDVEDVKQAMDSLEDNDTRKHQLSNHLALLLAAQWHMSPPKKEKKEILAYAVDPEISSTIKKYFSVLKYPMIMEKTRMAAKAVRDSGGHHEENIDSPYSNENILHMMNERIENSSRGQYGNKTGESVIRAGMLLFNLLK